MKTFQFIHPQTAEVFSVDGKKLFDEGSLWLVKINSAVVGIFTKEYEINTPITPDAAPIKDAITNIFFRLSVQ